MKRSTILLFLLTGLAGCTLEDSPTSPPLLEVTPSFAEVEYNCGLQGQIPAAECEALVALFNSTNGPGWKNNAGWLATNTPCSWYGVTCSGGHVTRLILQANRLTGTIPSELGNLSELKDLRMSGNRLSGPIPPELGNLSNLEDLELLSWENDLEGVPPEIWNLTNLKTLILGWPSLTQIPPGVSNLSNLTWLALGESGFTQIPSEVGSLSSLKRLHINYNYSLTEIPPELGDLSNLRWLYLQQNELSEIPPELGNLSNLEQLMLQGNNLSAIPPELGNASSLEELYLSGNNFTEIPPELGGLGNLVLLSLQDNPLSGPIPPELGNMGRLLFLDLGGFGLSGPIPPELGNMGNLWTLDLGHNELSGPIPPELGDLANLRELYLSHNELTGSIPPELGNLANLRTLDLSINSLTGPVPPELGDLSENALFTLDLMANQLIGLLPLSVAELAVDVPNCLMHEQQHNPAGPSLYVGGPAYAALTEPWGLPICGLVQDLQGPEIPLALNPTPVNTPVDVSVELYDAHMVMMAEYSLDEGTSWTPLAASDGAYGGTQEFVEVPLPGYAEPTVFDVCVRSWDSLDNMRTACSLFAVYNPSAGFVTGGGWIDSPQGAYFPNSALTGKANFGFVSSYNKNARAPDGNTEFQFRNADMNFHSETYDWLAVTHGGTFAQFKGEGTINGLPYAPGIPYKFMVWAGDGDPDTFRIRIWWETDMGAEHPIYDNRMNQPIGGGSIVVHAK